MDNIQRFLYFYQIGWKVLWNPEEEPEHISKYYFREQMKAMVMYTNLAERSLPYRSLWHTVVVIMLSFIFGTMCYGLTESLGNIVELGRDLAFVIAAFFILFKLIK